MYDVDFDTRVSSLLIECQLMYKGTVDTVQISTTTITHLVGTREADGVGRRLGARAPNNIDLGTLSVELSARIVAGAVQGNHLSTEEVLAGSNALRDFDLVLALPVDDLLGAPDAVAKAVLLDLEPAAADARVSGSVRHLLQVGECRALVRDVHHVGRGRAGSAEHVAPDSGNRGACLDGDDL